ncbi:radical SAM family heme chaperone HemW [Ohtaekwangia koreensis]|uniref:Heme chaperone HemW n=1 Tax=Ohtaekwangia koreensis TaxID=688867 RepID=A0A1T5LLA1_9BACT|nr:radical SAM family heme chaperone HemW [Ohtaekwangia koreensis]SKC76308.1 oxygen-independent coproporphyrinogen-3 oxidase [Ohtaekwangia koreensis]
MAGIYLHIPFCKQACYYCDFHFSTSLETKNELVKAISRELILQKDYVKGETINTIYFGGGTPSLLSEEELKMLFDTIYKNYIVNPAAEITLEANPDDLSILNLKQFYSAGVNRLSIGIQSFDDNVLRFLNRVHDSIAAKSCVNEARSIGFKNISIDLIYAIPGQDDIAWKNNIKQALDLSPEHISSYSLTIEDKTVFGRWAATGKLKITEDEIAATQLEILTEQLEAAGFEQYEISNFSQQGFESKHNSSYWKQEKYLGVGPSAHSYNEHSRQYNINNNAAYTRSLQQNIIPFTLETLAVEDKINDYLLTTLRTHWGTDLKKMKALYGYDLLADHQQYIESLCSQKLATLENDTLLLTKRGKLLADKIASDLFVLK